MEYLFYTERRGSGSDNVNWLHRRITNTGKTEGAYLSLLAYLLMDYFIVPYSVG